MEEAPTPNYILNEKPLKKTSIKIESNSNVKYNIEFIGYSSYLNIKILNDEESKVYEQKFSMDKIKLISKYFLICESISDVISSIEPNIKQSNLIEENNNIHLIIPLNHPLCKEAIFIIHETIKIFSPNELFNIITELKNNNKNQQNIINKQQETINLLWVNINELNERVKILENKIKETKNENDDNYSLNNSKIILNDKEKEKTIRNWINPNQNIKFELLFRKSRDGSSCKIFHQYCDNKGPTLTLVETTKGYKFGGYTPYSFQSSTGYSPKSDNKTFIFSLNLMKKFTKIKNDSLLFFDSSFGPCFGKGGSDFYLDNNLDIGFTVDSSFLTKSELTNGEPGKFEVNELEIYKVM